MTALVEHGRKLLGSLVRWIVSVDRLFDSDPAFRLDEMLLFPERPDRDGPVLFTDRGVRAWGDGLPWLRFSFVHGLECGG